MDINFPAGSFPFPISGNHSILVVSGWRNVGKTTFCLKAVEQYRKAGLKVGGLLSPGRFENHKKNGAFAVDLSSRESRLAASQFPEEIDGVRFGSWVFDTEVFKWGNQRLLQTTDLDVLVLDELGYLEFDLNAGWTASFEVLRRKDYGVALVVIRPECIDPFSNMGFQFQIKEITIPQSS